MKSGGPGGSTTMMMSVHKTHVHSVAKASWLVLEVTLMLADRIARSWRHPADWKRTAALNARGCVKYMTKPVGTFSVKFHARALEHFHLPDHSS